MLKDFIRAPDADQLAHIHARDRRLLLQDQRFQPGAVDGDFDDVELNALDLEAEELFSNQIQTLENVLAIDVFQRQILQFGPSGEDRDVHSADVVGAEEHGPQFGATVGNRLEFLIAGSAVEDLGEFGIVSQLESKDLLHSCGRKHQISQGIEIWARL